MPLNRKTKWILWTLILVFVSYVCYWAPGIFSFFVYPDTKSNDTITEYNASRIFNVRKTTNNQSGVNLRLAFHSSEEGTWGAKIQDYDFNAICNAGFKHIRIPVRFNEYLGEEKGTYRLDENMLSLLDKVIKNILGKNMIAIIDFHYFIPDNKLYFKSSQEKIKVEKKFLAVWRIIANRYKHYSNNLYFELANEPHRPIKWNTLVRKTISAIRRSGGNNLSRTIVVGTKVDIGRIIHIWDQVNNITKLHLPPAEEDPNIMVSFHYYNPYPFTHQGETYTPDLELISRFWLKHKWTNSEKQKECIKRDFEKMYQWAKKNKRKVILGEFSVSRNADIKSQVLWTKFVRKQAESRGMVWFFWELYDIGSLGGIYNQKDKYWRKEILESLQPASRWNDNQYATEIEDSIKGLIVMLNNKEWKIRYKATIALNNLAPYGDEAILTLKKTLQDNEWQVRKFTAEALGKYGSSNQDLIVPLADALNDEEWQVRNSAAKALLNYGIISTPAIPMLIKCLKDEEWKVRNSATAALGAIGKNAQPAIPDLIALLHDEEWQVRKSAIVALSAIDCFNSLVQENIKMSFEDSIVQVSKTAKDEIKKSKYRNRL